MYCAHSTYRRQNHRRCCRHRQRRTRRSDLQKTDINSFNTVIYLHFPRSINFSITVLTSTFTLHLISAVRWEIDVRQVKVLTPILGLIFSLQNVKSLLLS